MKNIFQMEYKAPSEHGYAIVDRLLIPDLDEQVEKIELISPVLEPQAHLYPWLVSMHDLPYRYWEEMIKAREGLAGEPPLIKFFFNSSQPLDQLKRNLVNALYVKDTDGAGYIVRYYDPSVFFQYCWFLGSAGIKKLLSMDDAFEVTFYHVGQWLTLPARQHEKYGSAHSKVSVADFVLFSKSIKSINNMTARTQSIPEKLQQSAHVYQALALAIKEFGLQQASDLESFATLYLEHNKDFYKEEAFQRILKQSVGNPGYFHLESTYLLKHGGF
jgi:hypothetical protein